MNKSYEQAVNNFLISSNKKLNHIYFSIANLTEVRAVNANKLSQYSTALSPTK